MLSTADDAPDPLANDQSVARNVLLLVTLVAITLMVNNFVEKRNIPIPAAILTVVIGMVAGAFALAFPTFGRSSLVALEDSSAQEFMVLFLAPLIFAEGYGLKSRKFFDNLARILTHAFLGTLLSSIVVAAGLYYLPPLTGVSAWAKLNFAECLTFGALISSTDPVTTLAIFKEQHMVENGLSYLYYTVLGESILNDAVALTLFESFSDLVRQDLSITPSSVLQITGTFFYTFVGSALIGAASGILTALILKFARLGSGANEEEHFYFNVPEIGVTFVLAYLPFLVADALDLSGVTAIMSAGICMRHYAHYNMTLVTRQVFLPTIELMASLCETYVFLLLGIGVICLKSEYSLSLTLWTLFLCAVARALHVYPFSVVVNRCSSAQRFNRNEMFVLWFAGLRGAVAFVCALGFPESENGSEAKHRNVVLCTTVVVVGVTMVVLGWPTGTMLRLLKIGQHDGSQIAENGVFEEQLEAPSGTRSRAARAHAAVKQFLMTSDAIIEREAVAEMISQRHTHISTHARPSNFEPTMGNMPVGGNTPGASTIAARYSGAFGPGGELNLFLHGRPSAPVALLHNGRPSDAAGTSGRPSLAAPRGSAPPRLLGIGDAGAFRSTRMLCNP